MSASLTVFPLRNTITLAVCRLQMGMRRSSRRRILLGIGGGMTALSGCVSGEEQDDSSARDDDDDGNETNPDDTGNDESGNDTNGGTIDTPDPDLPEWATALVRIGGVDSSVDTSARDRGAGFVVDGVVVTNQHILANQDGLLVTFQDGTQVGGSVIGTDPMSGLAVLDVEAMPDSVSSLVFATERPQLGQTVSVIGQRDDPVETRESLEIRAIEQRMRAPTGRLVAPSMRTDPPLSAAQTGSPILDRNHRVVGVVSSGESTKPGFGISSALCRRVVSRLREAGTVDHSFMGITLVESSDSRGVMIEGVLPDGPAAAAGLRPAHRETVADSSVSPTGGDVIDVIDGVPVSTPGRLYSHLATETDPGDTIELTIVRQGSERSVSVTLDSRPGYPIDDRVEYQDPHEYAYDPRKSPVDGFAHLWQFIGSSPPFPDLIGTAPLSAGGGSVAGGDSGIYGSDAVAVNRPGYCIHRGGVGIDTGSSFSMGVWIAPEATDDYQAAFMLQNASAREALGIGINAGRDVSAPHSKVLSVNRTNEWGSRVGSFGEWHFHVLRYDADTARAELWVDGEFDYETGVEDGGSWVHTLSNGEIIAGFRPVSSRDYPFVGRIAWPWITQGRISGEDIRVLYEAGRNSQ